MVSRKMQIVLLLLITVLMLAPLSNVMAKRAKISIAYAPLHYVYDGKEYIPPEDQQGFLYRRADRTSSTYVSARFAAYMINKWVDWDPATHTVIVRDPTRDEAIEITDINLNAFVRESNIQEVDTSLIKYIDIDANTHVKFDFDGKIVKPPANQPGLIINGRAFVPLRFFSETLGITIEWDASTYSVIAMSQAYVDELNIIAEEWGEAIDPTSLLPGAHDREQSKVKSSSQTIIAAAETQIASLQSRALAYFWPLLAQYENADQAERARIFASAETKLDQFDTEFDHIMTSLRRQLEAHGYDTDVIADYEQQYNVAKNTAKSLIGL